MRLATSEKSIFRWLIVGGLVDVVLLWVVLAFLEVCRFVALCVQSNQSKIMYPTRMYTQAFSIDWSGWAIALARYVFPPFLSLQHTHTQTPPPSYLPILVAVYICLGTSRWLPNPHQCTQTRTKKQKKTKSQKENMHELDLLRLTNNTLETGMGKIYIQSFPVLFCSAHRANCKNNRNFNAFFRLKSENGHANSVSVLILAIVCVSVCLSVCSFPIVIAMEIRMGFFLGFSMWYDVILVGRNKHAKYTFK